MPVKPMPNAPSPENPMGREAERTETGRQGFDAVLDNLEFFLTRLRGLSCCLPKIGRASCRERV